MNKTCLILFSLLLFTVGCEECSDDLLSGCQNNKIIFASFAESEEQLKQIEITAKSIREFAGQYKNAPIILCITDYIEFDTTEIKQRFSPLDVEIIVTGAPKESLSFYYAGKTFASGVAEKEAAKRGAILVWMGPDTIFLREPTKINLDSNIVLAYRPVMHNRTGTLYGQPPNLFWEQIYNKLNISSELLFPMITPADKDTINAYFNAGLLFVRPEKGILQKWSEDFIILYSDSTLKQMCIDDINKHIFLHQTALVGAVLNSITQDEMVELDGNYNYPLFFDQMFGAKEPFESIDNIVSLRYDFYFRNPDPEWSQKLKGPKEKIDWLVKHLENKK